VRRDPAHQALPGRWQGTIITANARVRRQAKPAQPWGRGRDTLQKPPPTGASIAIFWVLYSWVATVRHWRCCSFLSWMFAYRSERALPLPWRIDRSTANPLLTFLRDSRPHEDYRRNPSGRGPPAAPSSEPREKSATAKVFASPAGHKPRPSRAELKTRSPIPSSGPLTQPRSFIRDSGLILWRT